MSLQTSMNTGRALMAGTSFGAFLKHISETDVKTQIGAADPQDFGAYAVVADDALRPERTVVAYVRVSDVLVSRWWPGYRILNLTGDDNEEGIASLLATDLVSDADLFDFRDALANPRYASAIISSLFPRADVPIRGRQYYVSEDRVVKTVREVLGTALKTRVLEAYGHAVVRILSAGGLVHSTMERKLIGRSDSFVLSTADIKQLVLESAMKDVFSSQRLKAAAALNQDATPTLLGESLARVFRDISLLIPEMRLRLEQVEIAKSLLARYYANPNGLPAQLAAHSNLATLATYANFLLDIASGDGLAGGELTNVDAASSSEGKQACDMLLQVLQTSPRIEAMPIARFATMFGQVPAASAQGERRGLVMFGVRGQRSQMQVVDMVPQGTAGVPDFYYDLAQLEPAYVKLAALAGPLNAGLLSVDAAVSLANIVADELSFTTMSEYQVSTGPIADTELAFARSIIPPLLLTLQVSARELALVAMARSSEVAITREGAAGALSLLYSTPVKEYWRAHVLAATPSIAFFDNPAHVIVYSSDMTQALPTPFPARAQGLDVSVMRDQRYIKPTNVASIFDPKFAREFAVNLKTRSIGDETPVTMRLQIPVLMGVLQFGDGTDPNEKRGQAAYAAVQEPGVDPETRYLLGLACVYALRGVNGAPGRDDVLSDRAKSWLVENLATMMLHPAVQAVAEMALNRAVLAAGIDARRLSAQWREVVVRALAGTALGTLARFGKIEPVHVQQIVDAMPITALSVKANMTLATMPTRLNGSRAEGSAV